MIAVGNLLITRNFSHWNMSIWQKKTSSPECISFEEAFIRKDLSILQWHYVSELGHGIENSLVTLPDSEQKPEFPR